METKKPDSDYCGIDPIVTGPEDPFWKTACRPHDQADQAIIDGHPTETPLQSFRKFVGNMATVVVNKPSVWSILGFVPYLIIGGFGGILRQQQLLNRLNPPPKDLD